MMETFHDLLQKLQEVHEREMEGWQLKVKEISNKKGCDSKRMEELFSRNQQMKEQQRLLTENIKTLENRLRAGLCDRCTVTQEVAKKRQQEYEASQIQSLQHISILAGEMTKLKKENLKLKDEVRALKAAFELEDGQNQNIVPVVKPSGGNVMETKERLENEMEIRKRLKRPRGRPSSSCSSGTADIKPITSPDHSPSVTLVSVTPSRTSNQPPDGDIVVKMEDQKSKETECRQLRVTKRGGLELVKPLLSWKPEHAVTRPGNRGSHSIEGLDQQQLPLRNSSSSPSMEVKPRPVVHAPIPCHPQPIKSQMMSWPGSEALDWAVVAAPRTNPLSQNPSRLHLPHFPSLGPPIPQTRKHGYVSPWPKQSETPPPAKEPTVVFRVRTLNQSPTKLPEKKESPPSRPERVPGEALRDACDGPLDLSDRGKSKSIQTDKDDAPASLHVEVKQKSLDCDRSPQISMSSSPSLMASSSSCCSTPARPEPESRRDQNQEVSKEAEPKEETSRKTEQSNDKKVPVLTLSLRPVVMLETLNSAIQKEESLSSRSKSASPANEVGSSSDEPDSNDSGSGKDIRRGKKRRRGPVETEADSDTSTDIHQETRIKITVRSEERNPN